MKKFVAIGMCMMLLCGCSCGDKAGRNEKLLVDSSSYESESIDTVETTTKDMVEETSIEETTAETQSTIEVTTTEPEITSTTQQTTTANKTTEIKTTKQETTTIETTTKFVVDETGKTPYEAHGRLQVVGTQLVDQYGNPYQLKGASTHGMAWFPQYVSYDTFKYLKESFGVNVVRLAMYTAEYNGYSEGGDKNYLKNLVKQGVQAATDLGLYVIIDWHILADQTPHKYKADAIQFFSEMSSTYKNYDNVIYEICNEPNGSTSWADIKAYANEIIPIIRANDSDAIIIVGTPTWSQDVDLAGQDKITGYNNIMYGLHFYAATHKQWLRDKAQAAINNGCALFVSEFSICDASGNGGIDVNEANKWIEFLNKNNISYVGWNLSNKAETSAMFQSWCSKISGFDDSELTEWAKWLRSVIK